MARRKSTLSRRSPPRIVPCSHFFPFLALLPLPSESRTRDATSSLLREWRDRNRSSKRLHAMAPPAHDAHAGFEESISRSALRQTAGSTTAIKKSHSTHSTCSHFWHSSIRRDQCKEKRMDSTARIPHASILRFLLSIHILKCCFAPRRWDCVRCLNSN